MAQTQPGWGLQARENLGSGGQAVEAERARVRTHSVVNAQHDRVGRGGLCEERRREMQGIESADGLIGETLSCAIDDFAAQSQECPVRGSGVELPAPGGCFGLGELTIGDGAHQDAIALDERQVGGDDEFGRPEVLADLRSARFSEQPGQHGARFRVEGHRSPRSAASSASARPGFSAGGRRR